MSQSIKSDHISESTVARIAGNIASSHPAWATEAYLSDDRYDAISRESVALARAIVAEVKSTAPKEQP